MAEFRLYGVSAFRNDQTFTFPIAMAWYISQFPLPPTTKQLFGGFVILLAPTLLIANQPDLGTSILVASSGIFVLFFLV